MYVAENDQAKKSSSSILESSINPPDSALTAMEVQVVDQNTKAIHSSDLELTSKVIKTYNPLITFWGHFLY